jgi:hypothetical protein
VTSLVHFSAGSHPEATTSTFPEKGHGRQKRDVQTDARRSGVVCPRWGDEEAVEPQLPHPRAPDLLQAGRHEDFVRDGCVVGLLGTVVVQVDLDEDFDADDIDFGNLVSDKRLERWNAAAATSGAASRTGLA